LPFTVISGLFGMNFDIMPWLKASWGVAAATGLMVALSAGALLLFGRVDWLGVRSAARGPGAPVAPAAGARHRRAAGPRSARAARAAGRSGGASPRRRRCSWRWWRTGR